MYGDDVKLFCSSHNFEGFRRLKSDLLAELYKMNGMSLNVEKYISKSFSRGSFIIFGCELNSEPLQSALPFKKLGVVFDGKMTFTLYLKSVVCNTRSSLGFTKRWSKDFDKPYVKRISTLD